MNKKEEYLEILTEEPYVIGNLLGFKDLKKIITN